jgi:hypothetical protein
MYMLKKNWQAIGFLVVLISCLGFGVVYSQVADTQPMTAPVVEPVVAAPVAAAPVVAPTNPLPVDPVDLIAVIKLIIEAFGSTWYLGLALVLYMLVNLLRGKLKIGSWIIRIPYVSDWIDGIGATWKAVVIVGVTAIGGAFAGMALAPLPWAAGSLATAMVSGLISGALLAFAAMGVDSAVSTVKKPEVAVAAIAAKTAETGKLPKLDAETLAEIEKWAVAARAKLNPPK